MQKAEKRLQFILKRAEDSNISPATIANLKISRKLRNESNIRMKPALIVCLISLLVYSFYQLHSDECLVEIPFESSKIFREPEDCAMCVNVTQVDRVANISPEDFDRIYVQTARPVVVIDGTKGWEAVDAFNFQFFKELYSGANNDAEDRAECQFFPYKTEFHSLSEVFEMDMDRARLKPGTRHWYIGWSNCNDAAGKILRKFYKEPYFLPNTSENIALNWIFMGGPGSGAHMHVDDVLFPSWQAQLKGRKTWHLAPPPECLYKCKSFQVTVEPGEIIVVDTNRWYHQTNILAGSISITIGSEFD